MADAEGVEVADSLEYLVEYDFGLQFVDARLFVEVDPVEEIFFVIGHHYIQVLLRTLVSGVTA